MFFIIDWAYKKEYISYSYYRLSIELLTKYGFKPLDKKYPTEKLVEIMKKDNDSMKINIVNQTSQNFLNNYRLPNVTTIANTRKLIKKVDNGNRKLFSEKYNPYALVSPTRNRTGVNYIGALFQH